MSNPLRVFVALIGVLFAAESPLHAEQFRTDIVFAKRGDQELKLDIALPSGDSKMRPTVVCIHGGGWRAGNRNSYHEQIRKFAKLGYVAATIDYRLTAVAPWPAQIDDVKAALKFLVEHSDEYGIDPERIGVLGESAGGQLSQMVGLLPTESDDVLRIRSIVNFYGPTDLRNVEKVKHVRALLEPLIGGTLEETSDGLTAISPVTFVDRTDPPVVTFHGTADKVVPFEHAQILHAALQKSQIPNSLFPMNGAGHGIGGDVDKVFSTLAAFQEAYLLGSRQPLLAHEDFDGDASRWQPTDVAAWKVVKKEGRSFYSLIKKRSDYEPKVRSPYNYSLLKDVEVGDFVLDVDLKSTHEPYGHQDLCLFFGYQDASHFYYVHMGRKADAHANSIFLVDGKPRVSIAQERTEGTDWSRGWHRARITRDISSGTIEVYFDDMQKPIMKTVDKTFIRGQIGIGSFDDTGNFDAIRLWGSK
jgi:acetyl esterase/lipase